MGQEYCHQFWYRRHRWNQKLQILTGYGKDDWGITMCNHFTVTSPMLNVY